MAIIERPSAVPATVGAPAPAELVTISKPWTTPDVSVSL